MMIRVCVICGKLVDAVSDATMLPVVNARHCQKHFYERASMSYQKNKDKISKRFAKRKEIKKYERHVKSKLRRKFDVEPPQEIVDLQLQINYMNRKI